MMDTLPKHIEAELAMFGVVFTCASDDIDDNRPQYTVWMPSYEGEDPPF